MRRIRLFDGFVVCATFYYFGQLYETNLFSYVATLFFNVLLRRVLLRSVRRRTEREILCFSRDLV